MASTGGKPIGLPPAVMIAFGPLPLRIEGDDSAFTLLALQPHLDHVRAAVIVEIQFLAMHAVNALIDVAQWD
jgi:hypothetical protein